MLTEIEGVFVKIAFAEEVDVVLARGASNRPAARFNSVGQDALYLSPDETSARVAIGEYIEVGDAARVLIRYEIERCSMYDLRHPSAASIHALAAQPWQTALAAGRDPDSWKAADHIRKLGHAGLIDPSRRQPGRWHITMFRWNEPGGPSVRQLGEPTPIAIQPNRG